MVVGKVDDPIMEWKFRFSILNNGFILIYWIFFFNILKAKIYQNCLKWLQFFIFVRCLQ